MKKEEFIDASQFDSAYLFSIIGEKNRLRILHFLIKGSQTVERILQHTQLEKTLLSKHLKSLKKAGLVRAFRSGRNFEYQINPGIVRPKHKNSIFLSCCEIKLKRI